MKRGAGSRNYGQHRRAVTGTFYDVLDQHEERARAEKQKLLDALTTLEIFIDCAGDVRSYHVFEDQREPLTIPALNALAQLKALVDGTDFYFE